MNIKPHGIDTENLDPTVSPKEDFFLYACGGWMKKNPLPAEYSRFGMFDKLRDNSREQLKDLIVNLSQHKDAKTPTPWRRRSATFMPWVSMKRG